MRAYGDIVIRIRLSCSNKTRTIIKISSVTHFNSNTLQPARDNYNLI